MSLIALRQHLKHCAWGWLNPEQISRMDADIEPGGMVLRRILNKGISINCLCSLASGHAEGIIN